MKTIIIKTQQELDDLPEKFDEYTQIQIKGETRIIVRKAWGNSSVVAWENSSVVARENSSVEAWGNSSVVAWDCVCVWAKSDFVSVVLFAFACCYALAKAKIEKKKETVTIITPMKPQTLQEWLDSEGIEVSKKSVILYKRVSHDYKTQEKTNNETLWSLATTLTHHDWNPSQRECGGGKFHACSTPYFCDEFRSTKGDKYIAIKIKIEDLYFWKDGDYPHKIAFRKGKVLHEVNRFGKKI